MNYLKKNYIIILLLIFCSTMCSGCLGSLAQVMYGYKYQEAVDRGTITPAQQAYHDEYIRLKTQQERDSLEARRRYIEDYNRRVETQQYIRDEVQRQRYWNSR